MSDNNRHNLIFEIKGAFYRRPAIWILKVLPINTPLILYTEPWNTHDSNAIGVWIKKSDIPLDKLHSDTAANIEYNSNLEFHLGYIPAVDAAQLKFDRSRTILGEFRLSDKNKPMVKMTGFKKN